MLAASAPTFSSLRRLATSPWLRPLNDPVAIDGLLGLVDPTWSIREIHARVERVLKETRDARTLVLAPNRLWPGHRAGQHVQVTAEIDGRRHTRTFSISSPPRIDGLVHITVKRRDGGHVSKWWNERAAVGDIVTLSRPSGDFVLPDPLPSRVVFVSAGSGVTPMMAMLRHIDASGAPTSVLFVHSSRSRADSIFARELEQLHARRSTLDLRVQLTTENGRLDAAAFAALAQECAGAPTFVCGPDAFLTAVRQAWNDAGIGAVLRVESFGLPARASGHEHPQPIAAARTGTTFTATGGQSLLEAAEAAGLRPKHGCRMGVCHTCKCRKISGVVEDLRDGRISDEPGEMIQLCISTARSGVTLDL